MYPQYLPRMPFSPKAKIHVFSPAESYLIAMGLEKHLKLIYDRMERVPPKTTPLRTACKRLCKDTLHGKRYRRVWGYIMHLQKVDYYNPIKVPIFNCLRIYLKQFFIVILLLVLF